MTSDFTFLGDCLNLPDCRFAARDLARLDPLFRRDRILAPAERLDSAECFCGCGGRAYLEQVPDPATATVRAFLRCPESGEVRPATDDDLRLWRFDADAMIRLLCRLLPCAGSPRCVVPGRLWELGPCDTPIAGRRRAVYFATRLNADAAALYAAMPNAATPLLFTAASVVEPGVFPRDRIVRAQDCLGIRGGAWYCDFARIAGQVPDMGCAGSAARRSAVKRPGARGMDTLARVMNELKRWIRLEYERYRDARNTPRAGQFRLNAPTMQNIAEAVGVHRSTVSDLLNPERHGADPNYTAVRELWDIAHDIDKIRARCGRFR